MDLNAWFQWLFPSPGHFLLALGVVVVLLGLIGGLTDSRGFSKEDNSSPDEEGEASSKSRWKREEEHYREWNAHQVREQHRTAGKHSALE